MGIVAFVTVMAFVNIALGYALASYWGRLWGETKPEMEIRIAEPSAQAKQPAEDRAAVSDAIKQFQQRLNGFSGQVASIDERIQAIDDPQDKEAILDCVNEMRETNESFLEEQGERVRQFRDSSESLGEMAELGREMVETFEQQDKAIQETNRELEDINFEGDAQADYEKLCEKSEQMTQANEQLDSWLNVALEKVKQREEPAEQKEVAGVAPTAAPPTDILTGLLNREGVKTALRHHWENDPDRERQIVAALIDIDQFEEFNETYNSRVGDQVIKTLALTTRNELGEGHQLGCIRRGTLMLLLPDADLPAASAILERVRQTVEVCEFVLDGERAEVRVSCAAVLAQADDDRESLIARVENTLAEAQNAGRNRTFSSEAAEATPVLPPELELKPRTVSVR